MPSAEFICLNPDCPSQNETWWSPVKGNRRDGYEATEPYCPDCEQTGEETGERDYN